MPRDLLDTLATRFTVGDGCWEWTGSRTSLGYGVLHRQAGGGVTRQAHRIVYEALVGPIPDGLELDHLCRNPGCVRPAHLEPVTHVENVRRGAGAEAVRNYWRTRTHCKRGHELTPDNLYRQPGGQGCRTCRNDYHRERKRKMRGAA